VFDNRIVPSQWYLPPGETVIFGYNTEIRLGDTVYHVQSEARGCEQLLETQVFVKGHCITKRSTPSEHGGDPQSVQESLRLQHRFVVECIRKGQLELARTEAPDLNISLRCTSAKREGAELVLGFQVSRGGVPMRDVRLRCFLTEADSVLDPELISEPVTDQAGMVGVRIGGALPVNAELQVEVEGEERKTLRRFRLRQRESH
jgi:hypothetical protein